MKGNKRRTIGTSGANQAQTVSTPTGAVRKVLQVTVAYSATPTHSGVTVTLNSGAGSGHDIVLYTGSANARYTQYTPNGTIYLLEDDTLDVTAPAGGSGITSSVAIVTEIVEY
jgi:hypothetical protein